MANFFEAASGEDITLSFNNINGDGGIGVTAKIYNVADTQIGSTQTLAHVADGLYTLRYTVPDPIVGDSLTVFLIPDDLDNSNSINQIKVRATSPYGHGGGMAAGVEINDDDVKNIAKEVSKLIGNIGGQESIWQEKLASGKTAEQELLGKSTPKDLEVKVLPDTRAENVIKRELAFVRELTAKLEQRLKVIDGLNLQPLFALVTQLKGIDISGLTEELRQNKELILKSDELNLIRMEKLLKSVDTKFKILQISQIPELANQIKF